MHGHAEMKDAVSSALKMGAARHGHADVKKLISLAGMPQDGRRSPRQDNYRAAIQHDTRIRPSLMAGAIATPTICHSYGMV